MSKVGSENPPHPAVDWDSLEYRSGDTWVTVICRTCQRRHADRAKSVRYRIRVGRFTGFCQQDARRHPEAPDSFPPHPAVDWKSVHLVRGIQHVIVSCPMCAESRVLEAKAVRSQLHRGTFTGRCFRDRLIAKVQVERPAPIGFDWDDREVVVEAGGRRRSMVRIQCPDCAEIRLAHPSHLANAIEAEKFRPQCAFHRKSRHLATRMKVEILQFVLLTDTSAEDLERLRRQVALTSPQAATG